MDIKQDWKVNIVNDEKYPFVVIDNWYTKNEQLAVWKELEFYNSLPPEIIDRAETTSVARDSNGVSLGKSFRWYLDFLYTKDGRYQSAILNCLYKARSPELIDYTKNFDPYHNMLKASTDISSLISYYENNDFYDEHYDTFHWTLLIWYFKEPKKFDGGDFILTGPKTEIKCKHNRAVLFPCCYNHKVTPIKMQNNTTEKNGRYTITHFYYHDINDTSKKQLAADYGKYENNNTR